MLEHRCWTTHPPERRTHPCPWMGGRSNVPIVHCCPPADLRPDSLVRSQQHEATRGIAKADCGRAGAFIQYVSRGQLAGASSHIECAWTACSERPCSEASTAPCNRRRHTPATTPRQDKLENAQHYPIGPAHPLPIDLDIARPSLAHTVTLMIGLLVPCNRRMPRALQLLHDALRTLRRPAKGFVEVEENLARLRDERCLGVPAHASGDLHGVNAGIHTRPAPSPFDLTMTASNRRYTRGR